MLHILLQHLSVSEINRFIFEEFFYVFTYRVSHDPGIRYLVTQCTVTQCIPCVIILFSVSLAPWHVGFQSEHKWKQLAELATTKGQFNLAQECLHHAQDYGALLLLATSSGNAAMVGKLAEGAEKDDKTNVAFLTYFLQGK